MKKINHCSAAFFFAWLNKKICTKGGNENA